LERCGDDRAEEEEMSGRIVVGVDGSETAKLAAHWAAEEARLRGATLELVSAWELPTYVYAYGYGYAVFTDELMKDLRKNAEDTLAALLQEIRTRAGEVKLETRTVEGQAARVLLDASKDADLLVVGSRGLGGFRELLLGSVSQQCAQHSLCPVVIVRHVRTDAN
jgi:nucleotide-binding universal stress UspA family protein